MNSPLNELQDPRVFKSGALIDGRWAGADERFAAAERPNGTWRARTAQESAGMPADVLNVVVGDAEQSIAIGKALCDSDIVRHLSLTGSTEVGRILMGQCAPGQSRARPRRLHPLSFVGLLRKTGRHRAA